MLELFNIEDFLQNYWQKKPLFIPCNKATGREKNSTVDLQNLISPEELAGLACEDFVESRLVTTSPNATRWELQHGPFDEQQLTGLPDRNWTLLVQAVDFYSPAVKKLLRKFAFIPDWRVDDVMVSFATDGGSVGPHFDYYDVFLVQGMGSRKWSVGDKCDADSVLLEDSDAGILQDFKSREEYTLNCGDILYLPPTWSHYGISVGDSLVYSIGFRTPSYSEIISHYSNELAQHITDDRRYIDAKPASPVREGEMLSADHRQALVELRQELIDTEKFGHWFGKYMSSPKYPELFETEETVSAAELKISLASRMVIEKNPPSRFIFEEKPNRVDLYVDGNHFPCAPSLLPVVLALCDHEDFLNLQATTLCGSDDAGFELIQALLSQGSLHLVSDE